MHSPILGDLSPFLLGRATTSRLDERVAFFDAVEEHPTETFSEVEEALFCQKRPQMMNCLFMIHRWILKDTHEGYGSYCC